MEHGADVPDGVFNGAAADFCLVDLLGTAVEDFLPLGFCVGVLLRVEAGNELTGKERPVGRR